MRSQVVPCPGCGGLFPNIPGPTHRYMESSPACWATYGEVLAREYSDRAYWTTHRITVDCYAVQHPGRPSPQAIGSVSVHLIRLCATLERGLAAEAAPELMQLIAREKRQVQWLEPPADPGRVTVLDVHAATSAAEHVAAVRAWAESLWRAWSDHHGQVRSWLDAYAPDPRWGRSAFP
jgi:hypothetical protein